jgi:hypothetical protein
MKRKISSGLTMIRSEKLPSSVEKYLKKFAEHKWNISNDYKRSFNQIIVIPSLAEFDSLPVCLKSLEENDYNLLSDTLVLVVVNNSVNASTEVKENNRKTINYLKCYSGNLQLSFIDASTDSNALPDKFAGVGYARKIGCDLALTKFNYSNSVKNILLFLDADCTVRRDYLQKILSEFYNKDLHSAVVEYEHIFYENSPEAEAIICYEIFLRYNRLGLIFAGSYYNYHTIGSTIVCDVESYIKAGGMNKRKAGEDFYFLEKLAKQNKLYTIKAPLVFPSARKSWRVPFGTGQRITRHLSKTKDEYVAYNPYSFVLLKSWLKYFMSSNSTLPEEILNESEKIHPLLKEFLIKNNFEKDWERIFSNNISINEIQKQKIFWFDAFRTLKFIHYLRDNAFPDINLFDATDEMLKLMKIESDIHRDKPIPELEIQKQYLLFLRKTLTETNSL